MAAELYNVRAATHRACDRIVFDLNGLGQVGYLVRYVPTVHADPSDRPIPVAGAAALQVTIQAPDFRESGHQAWRTPWQLGQRLAGGGTTLRECGSPAPSNTSPPSRSACAPVPSGS
jgi:hypothetical protein